MAEQREGTDGHARDSQTVEVGAPIRVCGRLGVPTDVRVCCCSAQLMPSAFDSDMLHTAAVCAITGAVFVGNQLLSVGADGNVCIWALASPASSTPAGQWDVSGASAAANSSLQAVSTSLAAPRALEPHHQQRQQEEPEGPASLRSWLEHRRLAGTAAGCAGGVAIVQQQPTLVDEGEGCHASVAPKAILDPAAASLGCVRQPLLWHILQEQLHFMHSVGSGYARVAVHTISTIEKLPSGKDCPKRVRNGAARHAPCVSLVPVPPEHCCCAALPGALLWRRPAAISPVC